MRRAALLYNPNAGRRSAAGIIQPIANALREQAVEVQLIATEGPGTAGRQTVEACQQGLDILFVCSCLQPPNPYKSRHLLHPKLFSSENGHNSPCQAPQTPHNPPTPTNQTK